MKRVIKGSAGPQDCQDRRKSSRKETRPCEARRVKKVNLDFRGCQGLERKENLENQGPVENQEKMVKKEKKGVQGFQATQGTQDSLAKMV